MSILTGLISELVGGVLEGVLDSSKPGPPFTEGPVNASMGAAAGFMAFLSLMLGVPASIGAIGLIGVRESGSLLVLGLGFGSGLLAWGAIRTGNRALLVTKRNATLSQMSRAVGYMFLAASVVSSVLGIIGVVRWLA
jgi:hypothetical protein